MEANLKQINESVEELNLLKGKREANLEILRKRLKELENNNAKNKILKELNKVILSF